jgi:hypothetical protein
MPDQPPSLFGKQTADLGQPRPVTPTVEQGRADIILQLLDLFAQRWLAEVQQPSGFAEVKSLSQDDE